MSKAVVVYNSRGGNTEKVARKIAEGLQAECISKKNLPDLQDYDLIVVGSWVMAGRISFAGSRYMKKLHRKGINGKKVALFFTSATPDKMVPVGSKDNHRKIKDIMFERMEKLLSKKDQLEILAERFYAKGAARISKHGAPKEPLGHPSEEELAQAKEFGKKLLEKM